MNRGKRFAKKTLIYTIGSFGSKFLTFILLPLYTYLIPTTEYGQYDLIVTTISLIMPLVTLQTQEAIITGMISEEIDNSQIIRSTSLILAVNSFITLIVVLGISQIYSIEYIWYILGLIITKGIFTIIQQYARGFKNSSLYAVSGIIYTLVFLSLNIYQLVILKAGISGLFLSEIFAAIFSTIIILLVEKRILKAICFKVDKKILKWIIIYSLPLVPNAISWWFINASDRYVINFFIGSSANGIYAISYKFANVLQTVTGLVYLAWQEFSLEEYKSKDKDSLLSKSFDIYAKFLLSLSIIGFCLSKYVIEFLLASEYKDAWKYTGWLFLGTVYIALASQLNTCYLANNKTISILKGTLISGLINIVVDVLLINEIGIFAASFSTAFSAFILVLLRIRDNKKFYDFKIDTKSFYILSGLASGIFVVTTVVNSDKLLLACLGIGIAVFVYFNREIINIGTTFFKLKIERNK